MSEFHEKLEEAAADHRSAAPDREPEPVIAEVDGGGADDEFSPAESAPAGADDSELVAEPELVAAEDTVVVEPEADAAAPEDKAAQYLALAQRLQADFENYKKRAARDAALAQQRSVSKLVKDLLPALDNLERAIAHAASEDPLLEGIKLVQADLLGALTRAGIESFDPAGEVFDPTVHEAVAQFPQEGVAAGIVIQVYQQGYRLGDAVLRPARVVVSA